MVNLCSPSLNIPALSSSSSPKSFPQNSLTSPQRAGSSINNNSNNYASNYSNTSNDNYINKYNNSYNNNHNNNSNNNDNDNSNSNNNDGYDHNYNNNSNKHNNYNNNNYHRSGNNDNNHDSCSVDNKNIAISNGKNCFSPNVPKNNENDRNDINIDVNSNNKISNNNISNTYDLTKGCKDITDPFHSSYPPNIPQYGTNNYHSPKGPFYSNHSSLSPSVIRNESKRGNNTNMTANSIQNMTTLSVNQNGPLSIVNLENVGITTELKE